MNLTKHSRLIAISGALLMLLAVAMGAFGAHAVKNMISPHSYEIYQTAVNYHVYHALGLILTGLLMTHYTSALLIWAARLMFSGTLIFSGSLYLLSMTGIKWLGAITPVGGVMFLLAWLFIALSAWKQSA